MLKVIISAYAMCPQMGSEQGMAWNWCVNLAKYCELHIITESEYKEKILSAVSDLPYGGNMFFYWNEVTPEVRKMCWNQGDWRFYYYYRKWHLKTEILARDILSNIRRHKCEKTHKIILHQLNMIGVHEPGYLWKISKDEGIPLVWGPVCINDTFPMSYLVGTALRVKLFYLLKNTINRIHLSYGLRLHKAADNANCVIAASSNTVSSFKRFFNKDAILINETGCSLWGGIRKRNEKTFFNVLWVGKMDFRKLLGLALKAIAASNIENIRFHIVGGGSDKYFRMLSETLNIADKCKWYGVISHAEVQTLMQQCDVLLFTSLAEGTPHVVIESIGNSLPVICFDTCGHGDTIDNKVGRKVAITNYVQSVHDFAEHLKYFAEHRDELRRMSDACVERAKELSWESKVLKLLAIYENL
jgi:glycosyltransferase involved in cell wall biosynthesis